MKCQFFNPFHVNCVLAAAMHDQTRGLRSVATKWLCSIESAGMNLRSIAARRILCAMKKSPMFECAMARCYAPGGRVANTLMESFTREFV